MHLDAEENKKNNTFLGYIIFVTGCANSILMIRIMNVTRIVLNLIGASTMTDRAHVIVITEEELDFLIDELSDLCDVIGNKDKRLVAGLVKKFKRKIESIERKSRIRR